MKIGILSSFEDSMQRESGGSVRIYNLAKALVLARNCVKVILPKCQTKCENVDGVTVYGVKGLSPLAMLKVFSKLTHVMRPTALYFYDFLFAFRISRLINEVDVVQIEQQASGVLLIPFIKWILRKPVVIDCHDVFQALRIKQTPLRRKVLATFFEKLSYKTADLLLVVSESERDILVSAGFSSSKIKVIPNGVDTESFKKSSEHLKTGKKYAVDNYQIVVFVGNLEYSPNKEAIHALSTVIAPKVFREIKDVKFLVVGKRKNIKPLFGLEFTGFVNNVADVLSISDVAVAPLFHGSGTRLKILEYFSCGLPVVSTSIGAEGLDVKNGYNIFIADNLEKFASRIIELLKNKKLSTFMGNAGRKVALNYDWKYVAKKLETELYEVAF